MRQALALLFVWASMAHAEVMGFAQMAMPTSGSSVKMYVTASGSAAATGVMIPTAMTASKLYCETTIAPDNGAGTETVTFTVQKALAADPSSFSDTLLSCAMTDTGTTCNETGGDTPTFSAGDRMAIAAVVSAGTPLGTGIVTCTAYSIF